MSHQPSIQLAGEEKVFFDRLKKMARAAIAGDEITFNFEGVGSVRFVAAPPDAPPMMKPKDLKALLNRAAAAIETPDDLEPEEIDHVVEDLVVAANEIASEPRCTTETKCKHCDHFIEENRVAGDGCKIVKQTRTTLRIRYPEGREDTISRYVHQDDGEQEYDHDPEPGLTLTSAEWAKDRPDLTHLHGDGKIGPNSIFHNCLKGTVYPLEKLMMRVDRKAFWDLSAAVYNIGANDLENDRCDNMSQGGVDAANAIFDLLERSLTKNGYTEGVVAAVRLFAEVSAAPDPEKYVQAETKRGLDGKRHENTNPGIMMPWSKKDNKKRSKQ